MANNYTNFNSATTIKSSNNPTPVDGMRVSPGVYYESYTTPKGEEKFRYRTAPEEMARENRQAIDKSIKDAEAESILYEDQKSRVESAKYAEKLAAEDAEKASNDLKNAESNLKNAESSLKESVEQNNQMQNEATEARNRYESIKNDPNVPQSEKNAAAAAAETAQKNANAAAAQLADNQKNVAEQTKKVNEATTKSNNANQTLKNKSEERSNQEKKLPSKPKTTTHDTQVAKSQVSNLASSRGKNILSQKVKTTTAANGGSSNLLDLRNMSGKNFRSIGGAAAATGNGIALGPSRSFFLNDYKFAESLTLTDDLLNTPKIQPIILNEFQPYEMISPADILNGAGEVVMDVINGVFGALAAPVIKGAGKIIQNKLVDLYAKDTKQLYKEGGTRERKMFTSDPVQVVQNMFMGGRWLNTYELPYFGGQYLKSAYSNNWTLGDSSGFFGNALTGDGEGKAGTKMMGIDFPSNPKFKAQMGQSRDPISLEFYLINIDNEWLKRNFQFLNAIYAGSNWLHLKYCFIRPPNVYHVICPGRFQIYWAAIDVTVTFEGKLRKNAAVSQELNKFSKAIDDDMLWPDAWKININIRDLTPNNFNLYAEYYLNGVKTDELKTFDSTQIDNLEGTINDLKSYYNDLMNDKNVAAAMNEVKEQGGKALSAAKSLAVDGFNKIKEVSAGWNESKPKEEQK